MLWPDDAFAMYLYDTTDTPVFLYITLLGQIGLNIKHRVPDVSVYLPNKHIRLHHQEPKRIYPISPIFLSAFVYAPLLFARNASRTSLHASSKKVVQITPPALTSQIRIIRWRNEAHRSRRTSIHITSKIRVLLYFVSTQSDSVVDDRVMS